LKFPNHKEWILAADYHPSGDYIGFACRDSNVYIWDGRCFKDHGSYKQGDISGLDKEEEVCQYIVEGGFGNGDGLYINKNTKPVMA